MKRLLAMLAAIFAVVVVTARTETNSGESLFEKRCSGCHSLDHDKGGTAAGRRLWQNGGLCGVI